MAGLATRNGRTRLLPRVLLLACLSAFFAAVAAPAAWATSETFVNETFAGSTTMSPNWGVPSTPTGTNAACLTAASAGASPIPGCPSATDSAGSGALRFTTPTTTEEGGVVYGLSIPTTDGFDATFQSYQYGPRGSGYNRGADGISFFFAAANPADPTGPASIGQPGGELGYSGSSSQPGLSYGYLGIGLDVYGNFANTAFEGTGCTDPAWDSAKVFPNNVSVRGPGSGTVGYCMLNSTAGSGGLPSGTTLDGGTSGTRSSSRVPVEVVFNPSSSTVYTTSGLTVPANEYEVAFTPIGGTRQTLSGPLPNLTASNPGVPSSWINPATGVPYQVTFGWTGSTGGDIEYHEVNNVNVSTVSGNPPALTVGVSDTASGYPTQGATMSYDVNVGNQSGSDSDPGPINVTDTIPSGETPSSTGLGTNGWTCSISGQQVSCSHAGALAGGSTLPQLVIPVTVTANPGTNLTNKIVASSDTSDPGSSQDTVTVEPAPSNQTAPSIFGKAQDGQMLTASPGAWNYSPSSYSYTWYDCPAAAAGITVPSSSCSVIPGASGSTYTLTPADVGQTVEVAVTATNPDGTSSPALSQATGVVAPGPAAAVSVTLSPYAITANGTSQTTAKAVVTDAWGVPVPGESVAFSSSGAQSLGPVSDNGDGTYQAIVTSTTASGAATITAVDESMARHPSGSAILTQTPGPAAQVSLNLSPASLTADGASSSTVTATVTDAYGNPVTDPATDVAITAGSVAGGAAPSVSATSLGSTPGTYVATITSTTHDGTSSITAEDTRTDVSNSATLTQTPGPAAVVSLSLAQPSIVADGSSQTQATVTVTDTNGNPVSGDTVNITGSGGQSIGPVTPGTAPGTYVATITASTAAGPSTLTAVDTSASQSPSGSTTLTQVPGPATQLTLSLSPASVVGDGHATSQATARVTDANGNPVSGDTVAIATTGGQSVSSVTPGASPGTYVATITATTSAGSSPVSATDTSAPAQPSDSQTLTQTPDRAAYVTLSLAQPTITADGSSQTQVTATVTDQYGNPISGDDVTIATDGGQSVSPVSPGATPGTYTATITSTATAGTSTVTAEDLTPANSPSGTATLTQVAGPATQLNLSLSPASIVADGTSSSTATASVTDANGNPVSGDAVTISATAGQTVSSVTPGASPGTYVATITSTKHVGASDITATDTSAAAQPQQTQTLTQTPDQAAYVTVTLSHPSITADGSSTTLATATVTDQNGNPVSGDHVRFTSDGGQTIGAVTDHGDGTYSTLITSTTSAGTSTVTATDTSSNAQASGTTSLTQTPGPAANISLALGPGSIPADGVSTATATATVTDANGNPVSGEPVTITSDGGQSVSSVAPGRNPGTYVATITSTGAVGTATVTATDPAVSPELSTTQTLTQVVGSGDDVDVTLSPSAITADGTSTALATATVTDENGNPVSGDRVVFTSSGAQRIGPVSAGSAPGTYTATVTSTTQAGWATITAADTSVPGSPSGTTALVQTAGAPAHVAVSLSPSSLLADGQSTTQATITVTDRYGNPVSGDPVKLTSSGGQPIGPVTPTGAPGTYSATIRATNMPGPSTITATDHDVSAQASLTQSDPQAAAAQRLPTIQIDTPADGGVYLLHQKIRAAYSCTDPLGATDILSCAGPNPVGARVDTNELGTHAFTVTAVNRAGEIVRVKAHYVVVATRPAPTRPLVYLAGPLSLRQNSVFVPIGCLSPVGVCRGGITLRMTVVGQSPSGQVTYGYVNVGAHRYKVRSGHRWVFRVRLTALGRQSFAPGSPLPTITLGVKQLGGPPRRIVIN